MSHEDPIATWESSLRELMDSRGMTKAQATRELVISNPALHQAYIAAYTKQHGERCQRPGR